MRAPEPLPPAIAADLAAMDAAVAGRPYADGDPVLADLARLLRETRPEPDPVTAKRLDSRAATAFRAPVRPRRRPVWLMPVLGTCASLVAVVAVVVALHGGGDNVAGPGFSGGGGGGSTASESAGSGASGAVTAAPNADSGSASSGSGGAGVTTTPAVPNSGRAVERSASIVIAARRGRIDDAASGAAQVATSLGGFVASSTLSDDSATLDLRVPGGRLDQAMSRLGQLGRVRHLERSTLDITDQLASARRRVENVRAERRSLLKQLAAATTHREAARLQRRLTLVTSRLESARAEVRSLRNRANLATIGVEIVPQRRHAAAAGGGHWTPGDALHDAARVLEVVAGVALVALAIVIPLGLIGIPAYVAARRLGRRRREHALDLA